MNPNYFWIPRLCARPVFIPSLSLSNVLSQPLAPPPAAQGIPFGVQRKRRRIECTCDVKPFAFVSDILHTWSTALHIPKGNSAARAGVLDWVEGHTHLTLIQETVPFEIKHFESFSKLNQVGLLPKFNKSCVGCMHQDKTQRLPCGSSG